MKTLIRCEFCQTIIKLEELGIKDKDLGNLCKKCFNYFHQEFIPILRGEKKCQ